jgi:hypothetical protein
MDWITVLRAANAAACWHVYQRQKGSGVLYQPAGERDIKGGALG